MSKVPKSETNEKVIKEKNKDKWYKATWIVGIANLLIIISIAYSSILIITANKEIASIIMLVPMALLAIVKLIKQFIK